MDALAIASNNAKEIIGRGLVDAISAAFGGGSIDKATTNIEKMAQAVADIVAGLGTMTGWFTKLVKLTDKLTVGNFLQNRQPSAPFDPRTGNMPDMSAAGTKIVMARKKADAEAAKRQKELAALAQKQVKALKDQTALTKAKAVLDKSSAVLNMDLIQNTAALMGKVTADETLRLKLQQAILLGNTTEAGNLAQQLLASQIAAMKLSSSNPLGGFTDSLMAALKAMQQLRKELELLGAPKVPIPLAALPTIATRSAIGYVDAFARGAGTANSFNDVYSNAGMNYQDAFARPNAANSMTNVVVSIDPSAAQYGIGVASVNNSANGNKNNYSTIQSFAGGLGL
jgi:hypothetical protein